MPLMERVVPCQLAVSSMSAAGAATVFACVRENAERELGRAKNINNKSILQMGFRNGISSRRILVKNNGDFNWWRF